MTETAGKEWTDPKVKQIALVTEVSGGKATVSVLRKEACSACSGKYFCGSSKKAASKAVDRIGVKVGDTVEVEARSSVMLGYAALLFVTPIVSAAILYSVLYGINMTLAAISAVAGFVIPYLAAFLIEKKTDVALPVITRIVDRRSGETTATEDASLPCGCDREDGKDDKNV